MWIETIVITHLRHFEREGHLNFAVRCPIYSIKKHHQRKTGLNLSESFSSDITQSISSSPTDTLRALNEVAFSDTKIKNQTREILSMCKSLCLCR